VGNKLPPPTKAREGKYEEKPLLLHAILSWQSQLQRVRGDRNAGGDTRHGSCRLACDQGKVRNKTDVSPIARTQEGGEEVNERLVGPNNQRE